jgi:hypothetical protein
LIFFGLRMGAGVERIFQPAISRPMAGFFMGKGGDERQNRD